MQRQAESQVIRFAPGLRPVLKHGSHNQKDHAGKGRTGKTGRIVDDEIQVGDLKAYLPGSEGEWKQDLDGVSQAFVQWGVNYETRLSSATIMGLEGGFSPRGAGEPSPFDQNVESILRNPNKTNIELAPVFVQQKAQAVFKDTTLLMDASTNPLPAGTKLHRGARLLSDDPRLSAKTGDEFEMPLSAFATQPRLPNDFARGRSLAPGDQRSQGLRTGVIFTVEPGARGHVTQSLGDGVGSEVLAQGRFRVKDRKVNEGMVEITLEQVSYYDVRAGDWADA